jgi:hypothetical protein
MTDNSYFDPKPSVTERVQETVHETARSGVEIGKIFSEAVDRLGDVVDNARRPGKPLDTLAKITREAPLASLLVAFVIGMAFARRR